MGVRHKGRWIWLAITTMGCTHSKQPLGLLFSGLLTF